MDYMPFEVATAGLVAVTTLIFKMLTSFPNEEPLPARRKSGVVRGQHA
jgi:hypothetical protein